MSRTRRRRARLLPLLPRHHATVFIFLTDKHAPPLFTDACATARGHRGENELPRSSVDALAFETRGNAPFAPRRHAAATGDADHRARLGYFSCRCRCLNRRARAVLPVPRCFL
jgi:hypothetical protein